MKKLLGVLVASIWITLFFYFYNEVMPKGILYLVIGFPVVFISTLLILRKSGFKM